MDEDTGEQPRIMLVGCTGILGDIIRRAVDQEPVEVVGDFGDWEQASSDAENLAPDLVVWNNAREHEIPDWLMSQCPGPRVLAAVGDGRDASLWQLAPRHTRLGELSPAMLVRAMRAQPRGGTS
jgi:hypothetical protein